MTYDVEKYKYLWDGSTPGWVLLKAPDLAGGYCIFNELSSVLLHIDDDQLNLLLCQRMCERGCKAIDALPSKGPLSVEPRR
jgi:hypothetical protein